MFTIHEKVDIPVRNRIDSSKGIALRLRIMAQFFKRPQGFLALCHSKKHARPIANFE